MIPGTAVRHGRSDSALRALTQSPEADWLRQTVPRRRGRLYLRGSAIVSSRLPTEHADYGQTDERDDGKSARDMAHETSFVGHDSSPLMADNGAGAPPRVANIAPGAIINATLPPLSHAFVNTAQIEP
jgi:hypothetical protein